jgi:hypothetical protein
MCKSALAAKKSVQNADLSPNNQVCAPLPVFCAAMFNAFESRALPAVKDIAHNLIHRICSELIAGFIF